MSGNLGAEDMFTQFYSVVTLYLSINWCKMLIKLPCNWISLDLRRNGRRATFGTGAEPPPPPARPGKNPAAEQRVLQKPDVPGRLVVVTRTSGAALPARRFSQLYCDIRKQNSLMMQQMSGKRSAGRSGRRPQTRGRSRRGELPLRITAPPPPIRRASGRAAPAKRHPPPPASQPTVRVSNRKSCGRDSRWSPSFTSVTCTSGLVQPLGDAQRTFPRAHPRSAGRAAAGPGSPARLSRPSSRWRRPSSISARVTGVGSPYWLGTLDHALAAADGRARPGQSRPHQLLGEIGRRGDADQGGDPLAASRARSAAQSSRPSTSRPAPEARSVSRPMTRQRILGPAADVPSVEARHRWRHGRNSRTAASPGRSPAQKARSAVAFVARHVAAEPGQEHHHRRTPGKHATRPVPRRRRGPGGRSAQPRSVAWARVLPFIRPRDIGRA